MPLLRTPVSGDSPLVAVGLDPVEAVREAEEGLENLEVVGEGDEAFIVPDLLDLALPGLAFALPPLVRELDNLNTNIIIGKTYKI